MGKIENKKFTLITIDMAHYTRAGTMLTTTFQILTSWGLIDKECMNYL